MKSLKNFSFPEDWPIEGLFRGISRNTGEYVFGVPGIEDCRQVIYELAMLNGVDIFYWEQGEPIKPDSMARCLGVQDSNDDYIFYGDEVLIEGDRGSYRVVGIDHTGWLFLSGCYGPETTSRQPGDVTIC